MPRIAASCAVLLTAVTCIGFNTARYPVVWEMVAGSECLAQSDPSDEPTATPQSAAVPQSEDLAESETSWQSDWPSHDDPSDSDDWESTTVEPSPAYASYEEGDDGSRYGDDDERAEQVAMREPWEQTASEPERDASRSGFDPVAPQHGLTTGGASYDDYGQHVSDSGPAESPDDEAPPGDEATAYEDAGDGWADEPVEAQAPARYASYASGSYGHSPDQIPASPGAAIANGDGAEGGEPVPQTNLTPLKPAPTEEGGDETLAGRPRGDTYSPTDRRGSEVIPLPPVDEVSTLAGSQAPPASSEDAIPIYPSTRVD